MICSLPSSIISIEKEGLVWWRSRYQGQTDGRHEGYNGYCSHSSGLSARQVPEPFQFLFIVAIVVLIGQYEFYRFFYKKFNNFALLGLSLGFLLLLAFYREEGTPVAKEAVLSMVIFIALSGF